MDVTTVIGYLSAPTHAGRHYAQHRTGYGFRGRRPRWHQTYQEAVASCRAIERAGRRDGGQGRDCYIVAVLRGPDGRVYVQAGSSTATGLYLDGAGGPTVQVACSGHVEDATTWLQAQSPRWLRAHGLV